MAVSRMRNEKYALQVNREKFFRLLQEIRVEIVDGDVRFQTRSRNLAVMHICYKNMQYNRYNVNSSMFSHCRLGYWGRYHTLPQNKF